MKKAWQFILFFFLGAALQAAAAPFLSVMKVTPDFVLVLALVCVVIFPYEKVWWLIVAAALLLDLFSGFPFGLVSFSLIIAAYLLNWLSRHIFATIKSGVQMMLIGGGILIYHACLMVLAEVFQSGIVFSPKRLSILLVYDFLIVAACFYGFKKIFRSPQV